MYKTFYSDICFGDKNKWYYKIFKKNVSVFLKPYYEFREEYKNSNFALLLEQYCKSENPPINKKLRKKLELTTDDKKLIKLLDSLIRHFRIGDNIIVYRGLDIDIFEYKNIIIENGYLSTSLVKEAVFFSHNEKYLYKIFVPKGNFGFCPQIFTCRNIEYELILPRESKLQLIRKKRRKKYIEVVCKYVDNEI